MNIFNGFSLPKRALIHDVSKFFTEIIIVTHKQNDRVSPQTLAVYSSYILTISMETMSDIKNMRDLLSLAVKMSFRQTFAILPEYPILVFMSSKCETEMDNHEFQFYYQNGKFYMKEIV